MTDQTKKEWLASVRGDHLGTLVLVTRDLQNATVLKLISSYEIQSFRSEGEGLTKLYISNVPHGLIRTLELSRIDFDWLAKILKPIKRICASHDCTASKICVTPGCICTEVATNSWKCI